MRAQLPSQELSRRYFANLLRFAFIFDDDNEISLHAARNLDCSARAVRNWLNLKHDASLNYFTALLVLVGPDDSVKIWSDTFGADEGSLEGTQRVISDLCSVAED